MEIKLADIIDVICEAINNNETYLLEAHGISMLPSLNDKDKVLLEKPENLVKYDIILYKRIDGSYVLHRILKIKKDTYKVSGDNQVILEDVKQEQIIAKVNGYYRKNKFIKKESKIKLFFWSSFFIRRVMWKLKLVKRK